MASFDDIIADMLEFALADCALLLSVIEVAVDLMAWKMRRKGLTAMPFPATLVRCDLFVLRFFLLRP